MVKCLGNKTLHRFVLGRQGQGCTPVETGAGCIVDPIVGVAKSARNTDGRATKQISSSNDDADACWVGAASAAVCGTECSRRRSRLSTEVLLHAVDVLSI